MFNTKLYIAALVTAFASQAAAHGTITQVTGANGVKAAGFGIIASTPRNGGLPDPFEQDTSVIRDAEISSGKVGPCGRTKAGGNNDVATQLATASSAGLPTAGADGSVTMNLHQVNQDGAGPYQCDVSADGGATFTAATVTQNVPGFASLSLAAAKDFPLVAQMPAGMTCAGGPNGNACIMRCRNSAIAGPFGSCVAVANAGDTGATGNTTAAALPAAAAPAAAPPAAAAAAPAAAAPAAPKPAALDAAGGVTDALGGITGGVGGAGGIAGALGGLTGGAGGAGGLLGGLGGGAAGGGAGGLLGQLQGALPVRRQARSVGPAATGAKLMTSAQPVKRVTLSRIAGKRAGLWIDA